MWNQKFDAATYENDPFERFKKACRRRRPPIGDGFSTWPLLNDGAGWPSSSTPARSAGAAATRVEQGAGHPQAVRRGRFGRGGPAAPGEPVLQHHGAGHRLGPEQAQATRRRDPADQRLEALRQGAVPRTTSTTDTSSGSSRSITWQADGGLSASSPKPRSPRTTTTSRPAGTWRWEGPRRLPLEEAIVLLQEAEEERAEADRNLNEVLTRLGFRG